MNKPINSTTDLAKGSPSRQLGAILLITGTLALLSAVAVFAFLIIIPIVALLVVGIVIARAVLHSHGRKSESLGTDLRRFSRETVSEAAMLTGDVTRSAKATFLFQTNGMRDIASDKRKRGNHP